MLEKAGLSGLSFFVFYGKFEKLYQAKATI